MLKVSAERKAMLAVDSTQAPHIKGPKYKNTMFQVLNGGETSHPVSVNMWDVDHRPIVDASVVMLSETVGDIVAGDGSKIGSLLIEAPEKAKGFLLMSAPSYETKTGLAGYPTGRLVMALKTSKGVKGDYKITIALDEGDPLVHHITAE